MAVRRQLTLLEGRDLIFSETEKQKIGRPAHRYYLPDKGHEEFERDYVHSELLQAKVTRRHHILQKDHFYSYLVEG